MFFLSVFNCLPSRYSFVCDCPLQIFVPRENMTEINKIYNKMTIGEFTKICNMVSKFLISCPSLLSLLSIKSLSCCLDFGSSQILMLILMTRLKNSSAYLLT